MLDIPPEALAAGRKAALTSVQDIADDIAAGHHMDPGWLPKTLQLVADEVLEAAEAVWPHQPPKRDLRSTTSLSTERAGPPERARFGFGLAGRDVTA